MTTQGEYMSRNRAESRVTKMQRKSNQPDNVINFEQTAQYKQKKVDLIPRTRNQENLIMALQNTNQHIVVATGPAGTGKTYLAMLAAIKALKEGRCERIIMTRPAVGVEDEQHGFLPGNLVAKMEPWTRPLLDVLREYYRPHDIIAMIEDQIIEIAPLAFVRGRTFKNCWLIADEMQNATPNQMKTLLTRIGENSKFVVTGDIEQSDRRIVDNGLLDVLNKLTETPVEGITVCQMTGKDIQRHKIITAVLDLYAE